MVGISNEEQTEKPVHVRAWEEINKLLQEPGRELPKAFTPKRQEVLRKYLAEGKSQAQLQQDLGVNSQATVRWNIQAALTSVFSLLPETAQQDLGSVEAVLKSRADARFSYTEKLSQAALNRWERYRQTLKPYGVLPFSEQGYANIRKERPRKGMP